MLVVIESPFGTRPDGTRASPEEVAKNLRYLDACLKDSLSRGEAPFASHGLYPRVLNDATPKERRQGMEAGFEWGTKAAIRAFYVDEGVTPGMREGEAQAGMLGQWVEYRNVPGWPRGA